MSDSYLGSDAMQGADGIASTAGCGSTSMQKRTASSKVKHVRATMRKCKNREPNDTTQETCDMP